MIHEADPELLMTRKRAADVLAAALGEMDEDDFEAAHECYRLESGGLGQL
jgi:hypothetical protein